MADTLCEPELGSAHGDWAASVRAAQRGDRMALAELYDRYRPVVHAIALARLPFHAAEDVVHDVFITILGKLHTLRDPQAFPAWLATLAKNRVTDALRRTRPTDDESELFVTDTALLEAKAVLRVIQSLPEAYAETLCMRLVEGLTGPEIAERTGMSQGSVRVNLHRGMKLLREQLETGGRRVER